MQASPPQAPKCPSEPSIKKSLPKCKQKSVPFVKLSSFSNSNHPYLFVRQKCQCQHHHGSKIIKNKKLADFSQDKKNLRTMATGKIGVGSNGKKDHVGKQKNKCYKSLTNIHFEQNNKSRTSNLSVSKQQTNKQTQSSQKIAPIIKKQHIPNKIIDSSTSNIKKCQKFPKFFKGSSKVLKNHPKIPQSNIINSNNNKQDFQPCPSIKNHQAGSNNSNPHYGQNGSLTNVKQMATEPTINNASSLNQEARQKQICSNTSLISHIHSNPNPTTNFSNKIPHNLSLQSPILSLTLVPSPNNQSKEQQYLLNSLQLQNCNLVKQIDHYRKHCDVLENQLRETLNTVKIMTLQLQQINPKNGQGSMVTNYNNINNSSNNANHNMTANTMSSTSYNNQYGNWNTGNPSTITSQYGTSNTIVYRTVQKPEAPIKPQPYPSHKPQKSHQAETITKTVIRNEISTKTGFGSELESQIQGIQPSNKQIQRQGQLVSTSPKIIRLGRDRSYCVKGCTVCCDCLVGRNN